MSTKSGVQHKRVLFSIIDDTDCATLENVRPVYDLLKKLGIVATKTVWPLRCLDRRNPWADSATLEDRLYADWIRNLDQEGFEIAFHGASAGSNVRERTLSGLERFQKVLDRLPVMHINHSRNQDNLYWGPARFDSPTVRAVVRGISRNREVRFEGHVPESPYYWGDLCTQSIKYCRNLTFPGVIDLCKVSRHMVYADPVRPLVPGWFSSCDAGDPARFVRLLQPRRVRYLVERGGTCLLYVHFGAGFTECGRVLPDVERIFRAIAEIPGARFVTASDLLDQCSDGLRKLQQLGKLGRARLEWQWLVRKMLSGGTG
jgi:hypothetical protein